MHSQSLYSTAGRRKYITRAEGLRFLDVAAEAGLADAAFAGLLASTGCRISEALALTRFQLDPADEQVSFFTLKQRRPCWRSVPVSPALMAMLLEQAEVAGASEPLWSWCRQTAWRRMTAHMRAAGIEGPQACPRGLRHGFGVACALARIDPRVTQRLMGHSKAETTSIYLEVLGPEARELLARSWAWQANMPV